jgi:hypothetical protein
MFNFLYIKKNVYKIYMEKKNCTHKQKKEIIDNLYDINKDKVIIDVQNLPPISQIQPIPPIQLIPSNLQSNINLPPITNTSSNINISPIAVSMLPVLPNINSKKIDDSKQYINSEILNLTNSLNTTNLNISNKSVLNETKKLDLLNQDTFKNEIVKQDLNIIKEDIINSLMINQDRELFSTLTLEEIHLNFKTLGRIKEHDKMYLRDLKFLEVDDSYLQIVSRTVKNAVWSGYNREDIIDFLLHLTEQTIKACDILINTLKCNYEGRENTKNVLTNLLIDMEQSLIGLQKIKITYYNDNTILTRLDMIIDKFDKKIRDIRDFLLKNI